MAEAESSSIGAQMASSLDCEILDCPICFGKYRTPRTLPCLHTFCEECLSLYIKAQVKKDSAFVCPVCRASVTLPVPESKVEILATCFPLNHMVVSMMALGKTQLDVGLDIKTLCDPCKNDSEEMVAEVWCEDCCVALCKLCFKVHKRLPVSSNHGTLPIQEKCTSQKLGKRVIKHVDENCPLHVDKTVEVFCTDHSQLCCVVCFATQHRECKHIADIDVISKQMEESVFSMFVKNLADVARKMDEIATDKDQNMARIDSENEAIVSEMESTAERAKQHIDKLLSVFRDEVGSAQLRCRSSLSTSQKAVKAFIMNANNAQKLLQTVQDSSSQRQKFITYEKLRSQVASHYEQLKIMLMEDKELSLILNVNSILKQCIDNMTSLGNVETKQKPSETSTRLLPSVMDRLEPLRLVSNAQNPVIDLLTASITLEKVVKNSKLGGPCWLTGGIFLKNGNLLLADHDNKRLIELNDSWNFIKDHKIDGNPSSISRSDGDSILVAFKAKKEIYRYEIKSSLKLLNKIPLQRDVWGLAVSDGNIFVAGGSCGTLTLLSQKGDVLKSWADCKVFDNAYIATSEKLNTVYHPNSASIVCRDAKGDTVFTYSHPKLVDQRGIGLDAYNNVYVCGMGSTNLHQISADGQRSRILLERFDSIKKPYVLVVDQSKNVIVVTSFSREETAMEIYRLGK